MVVPFVVATIRPHVGDALLDRPVVGRTVLAEHEEVAGAPLFDEGDDDGVNANAVLAGGFGVVGQQSTGERFVASLEHFAQARTVQD